MKNLALSLASICALALVGCSADIVQAPPTAPEQKSPTPSAPADEIEAPAPDPVVPTQTQDFPASCVAARFTSPAPTRVADATTGLTWIATDIAYFPEKFPTPTAACGFDGSGFRAATTAEVLALAAAIPGCTLPGLFAPVYAWAPTAKSSGVLPIVTSDGCVDVKAGTSYAGACYLAFEISHSTLCVK